MTVFQFPPKIARPTANAPLTVEQLSQLTQLKLPAEWEVCEDTGEVLLDETLRASLAGYFAAHGLRLPASVDGKDLFEMWRTLFLDYAQAVRLAAQGRLGQAELLFPLDAKQLAYAKAVGEQRVQDAARLAATVFQGLSKVRFLKS